MGSAIGDYIYLTWRGYINNNDTPSGEKTEAGFSNASSSISNYHKALLNKYTNKTKQNLAKEMQDYFNKKENKIGEDQLTHIRDSIKEEAYGNFLLQAYDIDGNLKATMNPKVDSSQKTIGPTETIKALGEKLKNIQLDNATGTIEKKLKDIKNINNSIQEQLNELTGIISYPLFCSIKEQIENINTKIDELNQECDKEGLEKKSNKSQNISSKINQLINNINKIKIIQGAKAVHGIAGEHFVKKIVPACLSEIIAGELSDFEERVVGQNKTSKGIQQRMFIEGIDWNSLIETNKKGKNIQGSENGCFYNINLTDDKTDVIISYNINGKREEYTFSVKNYQQSFINAENKTTGKRKNDISIASGINLLTIIGAQEQAEGHINFINQWINLTAGKYKETEYRKGQAIIEPAPADVKEQRRKAIKTMKLLIAAKGLIGDTSYYREKQLQKNTAVDFFFFHNITNDKFYVLDVGTILNNIDIHPSYLKIVKNEKSFNQIDWGKNAQWYDKNQYSQRIQNLLSKLIASKLHIFISLNTLIKVR